MRWLMEFKMMRSVRVASSLLPASNAPPETNKSDCVLERQTVYDEDCTDHRQEEEILDTIQEVPETETENDSSPNGESSSVSLKSCSEPSSQVCNEERTLSTECNTESSPTNPSHLPPSTSAPLVSKTTDHEDALSADEGIQTSPPFETDDPWDQESGQHEITMTPTKRRYSMSAVIPRSPRCLDGQEDDGGTSVTLRSPTKSWLAEEVKARRWRYRPKSCSLPHMDWLKQRTETALDRSAEMQRRTAELLRNAESVRNQEV